MLPPTHRREGLGEGRTAIQTAAAPRLQLRRMPKLPGECALGKDLQRKIGGPFVLPQPRAAILIAPIGGRRRLTATNHDGPRRERSLRLPGCLAGLALL